jgi:hypothetical protein
VTAGEHAEELRSPFVSTAGGVMTEEAGAVTGDLELLTRTSEASASREREALTQS